ncbi:MAG: hypothetical protein LC745_10535 [Planctomycetia bacterium]|nr:hypothetical protein [Planctomycetia bacterium]
MPQILVIPIDRQGVAPRPITPRFRSQLIYFVGSPGSPDAPTLAEGEFWFDRAEVDRWLDDGVFYLVSPLDTANMTEVELTEEQEDFLTWLKSNDVRHVRVVE